MYFLENIEQIRSLYLFSDDELTLISSILNKIKKYQNRSRITRILGGTKIFFDSSDIPIESTIRSYITNLCFYYLETHIFESEILKILNSEPKTNILDFGSGVCELWCNNIHKLKSIEVRCIDNNDTLLKFPRIFLHQHKNITIDYQDIFEIDDLKNYNYILMIEILMQLEEPWAYIEYIFSENPEAKIIIGQSIFNEYVATTISPFKKYLYTVPFLETISGDALTIEKIKQIVSKGNGRIEKEISVDTIHSLFIITKKD